jgi:hypothetical protein
VAVDVDAGAPAAGSCADFHGIDQMAGFRLSLAPDLRSGRYRIRADFCAASGEKMPASVLAPAFHVCRP